MLTEEDINLEKSTSLTNLSINNGQSIYEEGTTNYNTTTTDKEITINATPKNSLANVQITKTDSTYENVVSMNNRGIVPISSSNKYTLTTGEHYFKIVVTPEDSSVEALEYHLHVTRNKSTDATLSSLSITGCPLNEEFSSNTTNYTCTTNLDSLEVNAVTTNSDATTVISGNDNISNGTNTVRIVVTPEDTTAQTKTYTITAKVVTIRNLFSNASVGDSENFAYINDEDVVKINTPGTYKLEVWGAQGGDITGTSYVGGKGGYSEGYLDLSSDTILFVNVGGAGTMNISSCIDGGYNGGGPVCEGRSDTAEGTGGGATHIATASGILEKLKNNKNSILIVAGGGGGASYYNKGGYSANGGAGGGTSGISGIACPNAGCGGGTGGTQQAEGTNGDSVSCDNAKFGKGGGTTQSFHTNYGEPGGGGGYYGGGVGRHSGSGGGSGYIGGVSNGQTIAGNQSITEPDGTTATGHTGN